MAETMRVGDLAWVSHGFHIRLNHAASARRAGLIEWEAISDGRTGVAQPWTVASAGELAGQVLGSIEDAQLDRQAGQRYRVEVWAEAMGWLPRLELLCNERGVRVFSGSGSVPVSAIRQAVLRQSLVRTLLVARQDQ